jgi:uncharacterized membrane-anchored protein
VHEKSPNPPAGGFCHGRRVSIVPTSSEITGEVRNFICQEGQDGMGIAKREQFSEVSDKQKNGQKCLRN